MGKVLKWLLIIFLVGAVFNIRGMKLTDTKIYAKDFSMSEIEKNGYNLNISRYVSTAEAEEKINLKVVNDKLETINKSIKTNTAKHNEFLKELGLPPI